MKRKYNIIKEKFTNPQKESTYIQHEDKTLTISVGELERQLMYDLKNGFRVEICGRELSPLTEINNENDILDVFFKEHGKDKNDPVYLTSYLFQMFYINHTYVDVRGEKGGVTEVWINGKPYYCTVPSDSLDCNAGLSITEENKKVIKEITEMVKNK